MIRPYFTAQGKTMNNISQDKHNIQIENMYNNNKSLLCGFDEQMITLQVTSPILLK